MVSTQVSLCSEYHKMVSYQHLISLPNCTVIYSSLTICQVPPQPFKDNLWASDRLEKEAWVKPLLTFENMWPDLPEGVLYVYSFKTHFPAPLDSYSNRSNSTSVLCMKWPWWGMNIVLSVCIIRMLYCVRTIRVFYKESFL